jgi:hypothetical protein
VSDNKPNDNKPLEVTPDDIMNIFQQPAIYVDHFFGAPGAEYIRLTFAESAPNINNKIPRGSYVMTLKSASQLATILASMLQRPAQPEAPKQPEREKLN